VPWYVLSIRVQEQISDFLQSEAGALQAGDLMQDLKTGHLLGAAPKAQFWGQVIGATVGAVLSAFIYRIYTRYAPAHFICELLLLY
jgi:hypothetical protein